jgi:D-3-phosphoglycerate dehydrogenase / 2-oxoglutarate reductase
MKIVVPDDFPRILSGTTAEPQLRALGDVQIYTERGANEEAELIRRVGDADVVLSLRAYSHFTASVLYSCPSLRMISIWGTGTDNVDLEACRERGVSVTNTPGVNADSVAEHTMALVLAITRQITNMDRGVRAGTWPRALLVQLKGKTLGVLGLGSIGSRVATLGAAFGMRVLAASAGPDNGRAASIGARAVDIETLLRESDIVSVHFRLSAETKGSLNRERLSMMKPTAFLINTARGAIVDRDALFDALRNGGIAGAGLDVFHEEPIAADDPLLSLENVVFTPHNAGTTQEVIDLGLQRAVENVARFVGTA